MEVERCEYKSNGAAKRWLVKPLRWSFARWRKYYPCGGADLKKGNRHIELRRSYICQIQQSLAEDIFVLRLLTIGER